MVSVGIAYKVVRNFDGRLFSISNAPEKLKIEYKHFELVKPKLGKLFIFIDLKTAKNYMAGFSRSYQVWECVATNIEKAEVAAKNTGDMEQFWNEITGNVNLMQVPTGTYFADSVRLTQYLC